MIWIPRLESDRVEDFSCLPTGAKRGTLASMGPLADDDHALRDDDAPLVPAESLLLAPPRAKVRASVARIPGHWFILAQSRELREAPIARTLLGVPLVLF